MITFAISVIAFLRPNIEALYKKYYKKPKVEIICQDQAEVGFNLGGPFLICQMTFLAKNGDAVVSSVNCEITNLTTKEFLSFRSFLFVSNEFPPGPGIIAKPLFIESGKLVSQSIQFAAWDNFNRFKGLLEAMMPKVQRPDPATDPDFSLLIAAIDDVNRKEDFKTLNEITAAHIWKAGKYQVKLSLTCVGDCYTDEPTFEFDFPAEYADALSDAPINLIALTMGVPRYMESRTVTLK